MYIEPILVAVFSPFINIKWNKSNFKVMGNKKINNNNNNKRKMSITTFSISIIGYSNIIIYYPKLSLCHKIYMSRKYLNTRLWTVFITIVNNINKM